MTKMQKYTVAGHTFGVYLPEILSSDEILGPYVPFEEPTAVEPLFTLTLAAVSSLKDVITGEALQCLNDEAPYFWLFEEAEGRYNFGFSYTKSCPDCILKPSEDYTDNVVYIPTKYAVRLMEFALSNSMMLLYSFRTSPYEHQYNNRHL